MDVFNRHFVWRVYIYVFNHHFVWRVSLWMSLIIILVGECLCRCLWSSSSVTADWTGRERHDGSLIDSWCSAPISCKGHIKASHKLSDHKSYLTGQVYMSLYVWGEKQFIMIQVMLMHCSYHTLLYVCTAWGRRKKKAFNEARRYKARIPGSKESR